MEKEELDRLDAFAKIQVIEDKGQKTVLVRGHPYMSWGEKDQGAQRFAIVELYKTGIANQEELAEAFGIHSKSIYNYITNFEDGGIQGLLGEPSGPKQSWKLTPEVRGKILLTVLKGNLKEYSAIQEELENEWKIKVSIESIRQVLIDNGFVEERIRGGDLWQQDNLFKEGENKQLELELNKNKEIGEVESVKHSDGKEKDEVNIYINCGKKGLRHYSTAERTYLDRLEQGEYSIYGGGLLLVPMLLRYNFLPIIKRIINIETQEGYCLEQLCLTLFYFDIFGFRSIENFKTVYSEEFGTLIGKLSSPGIRTLRRFLDKVCGLKRSEVLIEEFGKEYLMDGLVNCKAIYIDEHFLPYYGKEEITMGWNTAKDRAERGSYNFIANDEEFNPLIFSERPSSEDLIDKIPEIIQKVKKIGVEIGIDTKGIVVIFDREGYCAELFRLLNEDGIKFITWAKYIDKWVNDIEEGRFDKVVVVKYKIQDEEEIKYFDTEREMNRYGKIRAIVIQSGNNKKRSVIYTNDWISESGTIIQLICKRWGQENLIKVLKLRHIIDYSPGYESYELEEQPLVENPELQELRRRKASLVSQVHELEFKLAEKIINESKDDTSWKEIKEAEVKTVADIIGIQSKIALINQEIDKIPKEMRYDEAHEGVKLSELDYEKKRFLDCIKVFVYHIEKQMCNILVNCYDKRKELWPVLAMIIRRGAYVKLEQGRLVAKLRRFKNAEIDYAARYLCKELNQMKPYTLDKFRLPIHYEVV